MIRQHIFKDNFLNALEILKSQNNFELYYHFAPILMQEIPKFMVKTLIEQGRKLVPLKLLPALVACDGDLQSLESIGYKDVQINPTNVNINQNMHSQIFRILYN